MQLCRVVGARAIPVVSSRDKGELLKADFGCSDYLVRTDYGPDAANLVARLREEAAHDRKIGWCHEWVVFHQCRYVVLP